MTLTDALVRAATVVPGQGVVHVGGGFTGYAELFADALRIGGGLRDAGLRPGDPLPLVADDSADFLGLFWGAIVAGVVPVPLPPEPHRLAAVSRLLGDPPTAGDTAMPGAVPLSTRDLRSALPLPAPHPVRPDDLAFLQFSSGSTGAPKGVELTHANVVANLDQAARAGRVTSADVVVTWMPYFHDMGLIGTHLVPLHAGCRQVRISPLAFAKRPDIWLRTAAEHRATVLSAANFALALVNRRVPEEALDELDLSSVRLLMVGAEPISPSVWSTFASRLRRSRLASNAMQPVYGLAEATVAVACPPLDETAAPVHLSRAALSRGVALPLSAPTPTAGVPAAITAPATAAVAASPTAVPTVAAPAVPASDGSASDCLAPTVPAFDAPLPAASASPVGVAAVSLLDVGYPVPGCELRIVDDAGQVLEDSLVGHIQVRGPNVTRGYHRDPAATEAAFDGDWLRTGDLGFLRAGRLCVTGRHKDVLFINGRNFHAADLEEIASATPGLRPGPVAVVGVTDPVQGREQIAVFLSTPAVRPDPAALPARVRARVAEALAYAEVRVDVVPTGAFTRTTSGKLRRQPLRDRLTAALATSVPAPQPSSAGQGRPDPQPGLLGRSGPFPIPGSATHGEPVPSAGSPGGVDTGESRRQGHLPDPPDHSPARGDGWEGAVQPSRGAGGGEPAPGDAAGGVAQRSGDARESRPGFAEPVRWPVRASEGVSEREPVAGGSAQMPARPGGDVGDIGPVRSSAGPDLSSPVLTDPGVLVGAMPDAPLSRADVERLVRAIWARVLRVPADTIGSEDRFLEIGGSSLTAMEVLAGLEDAFGCDLDPAMLRDCATVAAVADRLLSVSAAAVPGHPSPAAAWREPVVHLVPVEAGPVADPVPVQARPVVASGAGGAGPVMASAVSRTGSVSASDGVRAAVTSEDATPATDVPAPAPGVRSFPSTRPEHDGPMSGRGRDAATTESLPAVQPPAVVGDLARLQTAGPSAQSGGAGGGEPGDQRVGRSAGVGGDGVGDQRVGSPVEPGRDRSGNVRAGSSVGAAEERPGEQGAASPAEGEGAEMPQSPARTGTATERTPEGAGSRQGEGCGALAVLGMACRFPGADTPEEFWRNLVAGQDSVTAVTRWAGGGHGAFLADPALFDAAYFGIGAEEARLLDPHARIFLELAHEALEKAGYAGPRRKSRRIGVFAAVGESGYPELLAAAAAAGRAGAGGTGEAAPGQKTGVGAGAAGAYALTGSLRNLIAARVAHLLDLRGPAIAVDTACSSALVALHLARLSLAAGDCDIAVVGGVSLNLTATGESLLSAAQALSPTGRCRAFAAGADGFVPGEGGAALVLTRLADAGPDRVLAVVRGTAVNNDGRSLSLMAPNPLLQQEVIADAYRNSGVDPADVTYIEAHGTGTAVGDPIEARSLASAFPPRHDGRPRLLGSVKTNIGHLLNVAGLPALVKVILALHHRELPPSLHYDRPSPRFDLAAAGFEVVTGLRPWAGPLLAGVNGFGFGGTNAHVILAAAPSGRTVERAYQVRGRVQWDSDEQTGGPAAHPLPAGHPAARASQPTGSERENAGRSDPSMRSAGLAGVRPSRPAGWEGQTAGGPHLLTLSARSGAALRAAATELAAHVRKYPGLPTADVCATASTARDDGPYRIALVTDNDLPRQLSGVVPGPPLGRPARVAFLFAGQGTQRPGQGADLYVTAPVFRSVLDEVSAAAGPIAGRTLTEWCTDPEVSAAELARTEVTQPLVVAFGVAQAAQLAAYGIRPAAVAGHSVGELAAAVTTGRLTAVEAVLLAAERGRLTATLAEPGAMLAVAATATTIAAVLARPSTGFENRPRRSGSAAADSFSANGLPAVGSSADGSAAADRSAVGVSAIGQEVRVAGGGSVAGTSATGVDVPALRHGSGAADGNAHASAPEAESRVGPVADERKQADESVPLAAAGVVVAAENAVDRVVLAGAPEAIEQVAERLNAHGVATRRLTVSHAFHSPAMNPVADSLGRLAPPFRRTAIPQFSTVTGEWGASFDAAYLAAHAVRPVRFAAAVAHLRDAGFDIMVEMGGSVTLSSFVRRTATVQAGAGDAEVPQGGVQGATASRAGVQGTAIPRADVQGTTAPRADVRETTVLPAGLDAAALLATAGALWLRGVPLDRTHLDAGTRRVDLPTYPFQRRRYWIADLPSPVLSVPVWIDAPFPDRKPVPWTTAPAATGRASAMPGAAVSGAAVPTATVPTAAVSGPVLSGSPGQMSSAPVRPGDITPVATGTGAAVTVLVADAVGVEAAFAAITSAPVDGSLLVVTCDLYATGADLYATGAGLCATGAELCATGSERPAPGHAVWAGLAMAFADENPRAGVRIVDLGSGDTEAARQAAVEAETAKPPTAGSAEIVAWRGGRRLTRVFVPVEDSADQVSAVGAGLRRALPVDRAVPAVVPRDGSYLIVGGAGAAGAEIARDLARRGRPRLLLAGRSAEPVALLGELRELGATAEYRVADVTVAEDVAALVTGRDFDVVVQAAGVVRPGSLRAKTSDEVAAGLAAKVRGTVLLTRALGDRRPLVVALSSISSVQPGLAGAVGDYVAGNVFLDAFAAAERAAGRSFVAVNLPALTGGGLAAALAAARRPPYGRDRAGTPQAGGPGPSGMPGGAGTWSGTGDPGASGGSGARNGLPGTASDVAGSLPIERVPEVLWAAAGLGVAQVLVTAPQGERAPAGQPVADQDTPAAWSTAVRRGIPASPPVSSDPWVAAHRTPGERPAGAGVSGPAGSRPGTTESAAIGWGRAELVAVVRELLAGPLEREAESIGIDEPFLALGLDSLTAVDLVKELEKRLGRTLSTTLFFEHRTIGELTGHLASSGPVVFGLSPVQRAFVTTGRLYPEVPAYAYVRQTLEGPVDAERLGLAFAELERRHPMLRVRFGTDGQYFVASAGRRPDWFTVVELEGLGAQRGHEGPGAQPGHERTGFTASPAAPAGSVGGVSATSAGWENHVAAAAGWLNETAAATEWVNETSAAWTAPADADGTSEPVRSRSVTELDAELRNRPFDLTREAPVRAVLVQAGREPAHLIVVVHHAAGDGYSMAVLGDELWALYDGTEIGPAPAVTFADHEARRRDPAAADIEYWQRALAGYPRLRLPFDGDAEGEPRAPFGVHQTVVEAELGEKLTATARAAGVSVFHLLLAGYVRCLARWSGQEVVPVSVARAGRESRLAGVERMVGPFADTLPVLAEVRAGESAVALAARLRDVWLAAEQHGSVSTVDLARMLAADGAGLRTASPAGFSFARFPGSGLTGANVLALTAGTASAATRLGLVCFEARGALHFSWNYPLALFRESTVERFAEEHLAEIISLAGPTAGELAGATAAAVRAMGGAEALPAGASLVERIRQQCRRTPDGVAVTTDGAALTYREMDVASDQLAGFLAARGERRIGLLTSAGADTVIGVVGILKAGAAWVPMDVSHPPARLADQLSRAGVDMVVCDAGTRSAAEALGRRGFTLVEAGAAAGGPLLKAGGARMTEGAVPGGAPDDTAYVIFTSGSTGRPKGVAVSHRAMAGYLDWAIAAFGYREGDRLAQTASICFDASVRQLLAPLLVGATVVAWDRDTVRDPELLVRRLERDRVTVWSSVPALWERVLTAAEASRADLSRLRWVHVGGEELSAAHVRRWFDLLGPGQRVTNLYGPTETTINATWHLIDARPGDEVARLPIGRPVDGAVVEVVAPGGRVCADGEIGELYIGGSGLADGYLDDPEQTAAAFVERDGRRWYRSGDLVMRDADGVLWFHGRADDQVKLHGYRVEPGEVEAVLRQHPAVERAVVRAERRRLIAWVQSSSVDGPSLRAHLAGLLPDYLVPGRIEVVEELPLTSTGKIDRASLAGAPRGGRAGQAGRADQGELGGRDRPGTATERLLADLWTRQLGVTAVERGDDFFALGGDSIGVLELFASLAEHRPVLPRPTVLYRHRTLAGLAAVIDAAAADVPVAGDEVAGAAPAGNFPVTLTQRGFLLAEAVGAPSAWLAAPRLHGPLDPGRFQRAVDLLVARHPMLRTVFPRDARPPVQRELPSVRLTVGYDASPRALDEELAAEREHRFDPAQWPLVRLRLLRYGPEEHVLLTHAHHLAGDGYSVALLMRELLAAYDGHRLEPLRATFRDYVALVGTETPETAPHDGGPMSAGGPIAATGFTVDAHDVAVLRERSVAAGITPFVPVLAAYHRALATVTGRPDPVIGVAVTGRDHALPDLGRIFGPCATAVAVRPGPGAGLTAVADAVNDARTRTFTAPRGWQYFFTYLDFGALGPLEGENLRLTWDDADAELAVPPGTDVLLAVRPVDGGLRLTLHSRLPRERVIQIARELSSDLRTATTNTTAAAMKAATTDAGKATATAAVRTTAKPAGLDAGLVGYLPAPGQLAALAGALPEEIRQLLPALDRETIRTMLFPGGRPRLLETVDTPLGRSGFLALPRFADELAHAGLAEHTAVAADLATWHGARTVSLAGMIPANTGYGTAVSPYLRAGVHLTTGHAVTAAAVVRTVFSALAVRGRKLEECVVAVLGMGSIGTSSLSLLLARAAEPPAALILCDVPAAVPRLAGTASRITAPVEIVTDPRGVYRADVIIAATSSGPRTLDVDRLGAGTILVDDSFPHCFDTARALTRMRDRGDVLIAGGGLLDCGRTGREAAPGLPSVKRHLPGSIASCQLESLLHATVPGLPLVRGPVTPDHAAAYWDALDVAGVRAAPLHLLDQRLDTGAQDG